MSPKYLERVEQAAAALQVLTLHPDGVSIDDLAAMLDSDVYDTRQNLAAYHDSQSLDHDWSHPGSPLLLASCAPPATLERAHRAAWFDEHEVADLESATWVALHRDLTSRDVFGVMLDVSQIVELLNYADHLLVQEPDNEALRTAAALLQVTWVPGMTLASRQFPPSPLLPLIRQAIVERRKLRFTYSREWRPGTAARDVDPYELRQTHLGYELDAGPVRKNGHIRTFLVRNIADLTVLSETFADPPDKRTLIDRNRATIKVRVVVPKAVGRAYESLAQDLVVEGTATEADEDWELVVTLQQPFEERLALFLMRAGPEAFLVPDIGLLNDLDFQRFCRATPERARTLLEHHGLV